VSLSKWGAPKWPPILVINPLRLLAVNPHQPFNRPRVNRPEVNRPQVKRLSVNQIAMSSW